MNKNLDQPPSEEQIERLLSSFQPNPGVSYYQKMEASPWNRSQQSKARISQWRDYLKPRAVWAFSAAALALVLVFTGILFVPSLQAVAQNILQFLDLAASDNISVPVNINYPDDSTAFMSPEYFNLGLSEAFELAGYPIKQINVPQEKLTFSGAAYDQTLQRVTIWYANPDFDLYFSQRPAGGIEEYSKIGASASVDIVKVYGIEGEYVTGGWRLSSSEINKMETGLPGTQASVKAYWDDSLPQQILRWQTDGYIYEILTIGEPKLEAKDLINLAERVK